MKKESKTWLTIVVVLLAIFLGLWFYPLARVMAPSSMGIKVTSDWENLEPNTTSELSFVIQDNNGEVMKSFEVEHEQLLHLIIVRDDLQDFQHLHPNFDIATGTFTTSLSFPEPGPYTLYADFVSAQEGHTVLSFKASVTGDYLPVEPVVNVMEKTTVGDLEVTPQFPTTLKTGDMVTYGFDVTKEGEPVEFEPYLGAIGHSVVLHVGDLNYLHAHADEGALSFMTTFTQTGTYVAYTQFQVGDYVYTARTVFEVGQGTGGSGSHMTK
jgi:hypothetical protein